MKFFRETTSGHAVVMGRKTWLTIGKPLKNRLNIVLSRDTDIEPQESLIVFSDIESVLSFNKSLSTDLFVIGGAQIYEAFRSISRSGSLLSSARSAWVRTHSCRRVIWMGLKLSIQSHWTTTS
jgi:hypothetical protein